MSSSHRFAIVVVGGGIGGLLVANHLQRAGHSVTLIEQKSSYLETNSGGGLNITRNGFRCIDAVGLGDAFEDIAEAGNLTQSRRNGGKAFRNIPKKYKHYMVHRLDLLRVLYDNALRLGVAVRLSQTLDSLIERDDLVEIHLRGGEVIRAALVIGADGINSTVRAAIPEARDVRPQLSGDCTFLVDIPRSVMEKRPDTAEFYEMGKTPFQFWMGSNRSIVAFTMKRRQNYHLQMNDHAYGNGEAYGLNEQSEENYVTRFDNMSAFRRRWDDYDPTFKAIISATEKCTKWKIAELPSLPRWSTDGGRIVLLGDAAHCFPPYAGQGVNMAMEDAATLSALVSRASPQINIKDITQAYERVRRPRIDGMRRVVKENIELFSNPDIIKDLIARSEQENDPIGVWTTEKRRDWTEDYDAIGEAKKYKFNSRERSAL